MGGTRYRFDGATGSLTPNDVPFVTVTPAGAGPRHFVFAPNGKFTYLVSEMSGIVTAFAWDRARGVLTEIQAANTMPGDFNKDKNAALLNPFRSAEVALHPSGKFLHNSNRGPDTIAVSSVDPTKGTLTLILQVSTRGLMPRSFGIDPTGAYPLAANELTDSVVMFHIEQDSGRITPKRAVLQVNTPVCLTFVPVE